MENTLPVIIPLLIILLWNVAIIFYAARKSTRETFPSPKLIFAIIIGYAFLIVLFLFSLYLINHSLDSKVLLFLFLLLVVHLFIGIPVAMLFIKARQGSERKK